MKKERKPIKEIKHADKRQGITKKADIRPAVKQQYFSIKKTRHLEEYFRKGAGFHGYLSPGLALGIIMVDLAKELLGPSNLIDAVVETKACIPDAIQLMTGCTFGNGWMRVKDWDKLALTLYDKHKLYGIRVFINLEKIKKYPLIYSWYMGDKSVNKEKVTEEIILAYRDILGWQKVNIIPYQRKRAPFTVCVSCGETFATDDGKLCIRCTGKEDYYQEMTGTGED
jgi:formylmethanofuran dehydrogenase subunit E